jgi:hypothetical protein
MAGSARRGVIVRPNMARSGELDACDERVVLSQLRRQAFTEKKISSI